MLSNIINFTLLSTIVAAIWAPILIWLLYKFNVVIRHRLMGNKMNQEFIKIHGHKSGTPRTGGLIISIPLYILGLIFLPASALKMVYLIGVTFFTVYGLADDLMVSARGLSDKLRLMLNSFSWRLAKLLVLYGIGLMMIVLMVQVMGISEVVVWQGVDFLSGINLSDFIITLEGSWPAMMFLAFVMVTALYAMEITDGADGLFTGLSLIAVVAYGIIISLVSASQLAPIVGLLLGASLVYLYFNINPARVFMGGSGTFAISFSLFFFAMVTNTILVFLVMGLLFWIELLSSLIQMISLRFFKRKVFKIAPIHHHFEAIGWSEAKVVQRFWLFGIMMAIVALWVFTRTM